MLERISFLVIIAGALSLSGCGGGGSSEGGGRMTIGPAANETRAQALAAPATAANAADAIGRAAEALPAPGSVTQSSNVDGNNVTTDRVQATASYGSGGPAFSVRNGTEWSIGTADGNPRRSAGVPSPWQGAELSKRIAGGRLYVDAYTDIEAPVTRQVGGGDGTRNVPLGTMILSAGVTIRSGGNITGHRGTLDGEPGTFNCTGPCAVIGGRTSLGAWRFTPQRPPGAVDVLSSDRTVWTGAFNRDRLPGTRNGEQGWFRCLSQTCGFSNRRLTGTWIFVPSTGRTVTTPDADYLSGGVWLIVPDDASSAADYVFGAFADGSEPFVQGNLAAVTGTATYEGVAGGVYSETAGGSTEVGYFEGDVRLSANFGDANGLGTIDGRISGFVVDGAPTAGALNLGSADIGAGNSGFFRGPVSGSDGERGYTGRWGGQFFGNGEADGRPGSVAGTFGGHSTDDAVNFVGAFGTRKR